MFFTCVLTKNSVSRKSISSKKVQEEIYALSYVCNLFKEQKPYLQFFPINKYISYLFLTYDEILKGWATQELISNINLGAEGINYCNSENERQSIIDEFNWIIFDAGLNCTSNIENLKSENINLSPNPTNNIIYINKGQYFLDVSIYNQLGQKLMFIEKTNHVDVNQLLSGTYIIKIKNDLNEVTKKFIKY